MKRLLLVTLLLPLSALAAGLLLVYLLFPNTARADDTDAGYKLVINKHRFQPAELAGAADYVYTPAVEYGEREIGSKLGATSLVAGDRSQVAGIDCGNGAKEYWFTEVHVK